MALIKRKRKNRINEKGRLIISASFLLITIAVVPVLLKYYVIYQNEKRVQEKIDNFFEEQEVIKEENAEQEEQEEQEDKEEIKNTNIDNYILVLDIPKLNLMRGIYDKDSKENDVNRNEKILNESDMPDKINGN